MKPKYRAEFHQELSSFSRYIRLLIKRARWTQAQFAKHLHVQPSTVTRWLGQETLPSLRLRKKMKLLDDALRRHMSKEDEERITQQARVRAERKRQRDERRRQRDLKRAEPKPERQPDQMTARVAVPVVDFEEDDEVASNG